jgi:hypothetical protein
MDIRGKCLWIPGGKIIDSAYLMAFAGQLVREGGAEKAGCTGDEKVHIRIIPSCQS